MAILQSKSLFDKKILFQACADSLRKLNPLHLMRNPVIFVTEVGAGITTLELIIGFGSEHILFNLQISLWLWFTVLFANFAEAMAEGRGKAQADNLRKTRKQTYANRIKVDGSMEKVFSDALRQGDLMLVSAGETIPADGEIIEGVANGGRSRPITGDVRPGLKGGGR